MGAVMAGEIQATVRGHLAADATLKQVNGNDVAELRVAVGVRRKDTSGEWQDVRTDWVDVAAWNYLAGGAATLKQGQLVEVAGLLVPGAYISTKTAEAVPATKLIASSVCIVARAPKTGTPVGDPTPF